MAISLKRGRHVVPFTLVLGCAIVQRFHLTIPGLPNPFLALFEFVYVRDDATWDAPLKLNDVGMATAQNRISGVTWSTESVSGRTLDRAVLSGGTLDGE